MGRTPLLFLVLLAASVSAAPAGAQERLPLRATLASCTAGPKSKDRVAVFTASMPALAGTSRMRMRFDLEERSAKRGWRRIEAPRFTGWVRSKSSGASGFVYTKRIERLRQGRTYRAVVRFRWYDEDGRLQKAATRRTAPCEQPDQRPDLRIDDLTVTPLGDGMARYAITIVNDGLTGADDFTVGLTTPAGDATRTVAGLAAGDRTTVEIRLGACSPTDKVEATADVKDTVDESDERHNRYLTFCPSQASGSAQERR